ncbi:DUF5333 domain-containing protein [Sulfitobacter sabulilitoris]|uniref:DUF5333 domain-containing protein n=1 Tax=Sulfitobacter sabulilitoris TaxID=2562655 RepID=A0A5S3PKN3_9RHOB|nr:DUF5333 domain-containing protein [Sulfitobacter sabulilitoris]TMM54943.1 hypothetical protein FDT80_05030 [Sulfitobacter sabulilitoris]
MRKLQHAAAILACATLPALAAAKPPLRDVPQVDNGLFAVAVANEIRKTCPDISARMFTAWRFAQSLEAKAKAMGYTDAEIEAHLDSDAEKARMKARGAAYFKANGVSRGDPQGMCALGRAEIQKSSQIGALLKAK